MKNKIGIYRDPRKVKSWVVRWFGDFDPATGRQRRYSKSFAVKREAEQYQAELQVQIGNGERRDKPNEITLGDYLKDFMRNKKTEVRASSSLAYKHAAERLLDYFGKDALLCKITPRQAYQFFSELKSLRGDRRLAGYTRRKILTQVKTIFHTAVRWELIPRSPFDGITRPKADVRKSHYLTPAEYKDLLGAAPTLRWKGTYALTYTAGLRFGELFSLQWQDVDFDRAEVRIENRQATDKTPPFEVKDHESRRIPLPGHTLNILADLRAYNSLTDNTPYVLLDLRRYDIVVEKWRRYRGQGREWGNGDMFNNLNKSLERHLKWARIVPDGSLSIHTLRKACITNWCNTTSNPEIVRRLAGHSDIATTMRFYSFVSDSDRRKTASKIDALLNESDAKVTPGADFGVNNR